MNIRQPMNMKRILSRLSKENIKQRNFERHVRKKQARISHRLHFTDTDHDRMTGFKNRELITRQLPRDAYFRGTINLLCLNSAGCLSSLYCSSINAPT